MDDFVGVPGPKTPPGAMALVPYEEEPEIGVQLQKTILKTNLPNTQNLKLVSKTNVLPRHSFGFARSQDVRRTLTSESRSVQTLPAPVP